MRVNNYIVQADRARELIAERFRERFGDEVQEYTYPYDAAAAVEAILAAEDKFVEQDVTDNLLHFAIDWLLSLPKPIDFEFLRDLRQQVDTGSPLSRAQAKGVLNCARAKLRRNHIPVPNNELVEPGIYMEPDGAIYKVQKSKSSGKPYAKLLVVIREPIRNDRGEIEEPAVVRFDYKPGAVKQLTPEMRLTKEQAREHGAFYGTCIACGRTLSREDSIDRMMGPVCYRKQFGKES